MNLHSMEFKRVGFLSRSVESQIFCWLHVFTPSGRRLGATQVRRLIGWSPTTFYALFVSPAGLIRPPTIWAGLSQPIQGKQGPLFKSRQMAKSARLQGHCDTVQWVEQINKCTQDSAGSSGFPLLFPHLPRDSTSKHWNYITNCEEIVGMCSCWEIVWVFRWEHLITQNGSCSWGRWSPEISEYLEPLTQ